MPGLKDPINQKPIGVQPEHHHPVINDPNIPNDYPDIDVPFRWKDEKCLGNDIPHSWGHIPSFTADKDLFITQNLTEDSSLPSYAREVHVTGEVIIRRVGSGHGFPGPSLVTDYYTNHPSLHVGHSVDADQQAYTISVPRMVPWVGPQPLQPCVDVRVTVWVPADGAVRNFAVNTVQLGVQLLDNLALTVVGVGGGGGSAAAPASFKTVSGRIVAAADGGRRTGRDVLRAGAPSSFRLAARRVEAKTAAADVSGAWPLYDYLGLETVSGSIRAGVDLQPAGADAQPATLYIRSETGDIEVYESAVQAMLSPPATAAAATDSNSSASAQTKTATAGPVPPRDYRLDVLTNSGALTATAAFSTSAAARSTSGAMNVTLLPVWDRGLACPSSAPPLVETNSTSGGLDLRVTDPVWTGGAGGDAAAARAVRCLQGRHSTVSADVRARYPAGWEGAILMSSVTGELVARGKGVTVTKNGNQGPGGSREVVARKGAEGGGQVVVKTTTGKGEVMVGEE